MYVKVKLFFMFMLQILFTNFKQVICMVTYGRTLLYPSVRDLTVDVRPVSAARCCYCVQFLLRERERVTYTKTNSTQTTPAPHNANMMQNKKIWFV